MRLVIGVRVLVALLAAAQAQPVSVTSPADRFVAPGEFVTLVFELTSPEDVKVQLEVSSSSGWFLVSPPATLSLEAAVVAEVEAAIEVPRDALAFSVERVTFRVDGIDPPLERVVELSATEVVDLELQAPLEAAITDEGLLATVVNAGNSADIVVLELQRDDEVLDRRSFALAAGGRRSVRCALSEEGPHTLLLTSERGTEVERSVRVFRFGTPAPEPFRLSAQLSAGIDLEGDWDTNLTVRGALSDFSALDLRVDTPNWRRSYTQVTLDRRTVRVGAVRFRFSLVRSYGTDPPQWSAELGISAAFTFDVTIPEKTVEAAGGRRLDTLEGSVLADGLALSGVVVEVSPFRVQTDARGRFSIDLPPGTYDLRIDTATLPSGYRLVDRPDTTAEVAVRTTTEVTFRATREAVISQPRPPLVIGALVGL